jgi:TetR/AcrR family transcriptional regulator, regulator of cefoperazone and chloramphenicol sensitivity
MNVCEIFSPKRPAGEESRRRILECALKLFANQGLERTTVRQIAKTAAVNVSAISYYFGDKTGLYKAAYTEPLGSPKDDIPLFSQPQMSLEESLRGLFSGFVEPLKQDELVQQCIRLHMREMVEPTGNWSAMIDNEITPYHKALIEVLKRHLGLYEEDENLHRLAVCIVALGVHLYMCRDVTEKICPQIMAGSQALDDTHAALVRFAMSMVETEAARRKTLRNE